MLNLAENSSKFWIFTLKLPHRNYIIDEGTTHCSHLMELKWKEMCRFVKENPKCNELVWHIQWLDFMFCEMKMDTPTFVTMIGIVTGIILIFLLSLVIISLIRLAPCFIAVSHCLKFDEHTSGAVLLVLISYTPDVIENAQMYEADTTTAFNEALGSAMITISLIGGYLAIFYPFSLSPAYFTRDAIFVIFGLMLAVILYVHEELYLYYALIFMVIYLLFLCTILVEFLILQANYRSRYEAVQETGETFNIEDMDEQHQPIKLKFKVNDTLQYGELEGSNTFLFKQFIDTFNPMRPEVLSEVNSFYKICFILGIPLHCIYILCIPCFDYTLPNHGWSKLMTCINLMISGPLFTVLFTLKTHYFYYSWIPGCILAIIVFCTSRTDRPPKYHIAFAFMGLCICGCFQFTLERELISILHTLGTFLGLKRQTSALTTLAMADNVGMAVWVFRLANWGYPKIGFAACFCAPLIDTVYSLGIMYTVKSWRTWKTSIHVFSGEVGKTSALYVLIVYPFTYIAVALCKFQLRKSIGVTLSIIYVVFLIQIFLTEFSIIHGLGTDHTRIHDKGTGATWA